LKSSAENPTGHCYAGEAALNTSHWPLASNMPLTPALLRLDPMLDPLRNNPSFEELVASPVLKNAKQ
jgi:hypothetical protein